MRNLLRSTAVRLAFGYAVLFIVSSLLLAGFLWWRTALYLDREIDAVIIATNHTEFSGTQILRAIISGAKQECLIVDPWNASGSGQVFAYASEALVLAGA